MSKQIYKWKRFWCPRTAQIHLGDHGGYLFDPKSEWGKHCNPELVGLEAIADIPCLVLLGEPGIGKSQEMKNLIKHTEEKLHPSHPPLELNLRSCSSLATDLIQDQDFIDWINGGHRLYLFLDSLDEGLLEIRNLATQLVDEFRKRKYRDKLNRLYLRIACRTAVFPQVLEEGLEELWKEGLAIYELAPLRCVDVETAATRKGIEPQVFLSEVWNKKLVPLAIKPITLDFLFNIYRRDGQFSTSQTLCDLYLAGCRILCDEEDKAALRLPGRKETLELDQRLIIAARIAAVTVFANRDAVWIGRDRGQIPEEDILRRDLAQGYERANERSFEAREEAFTEVIDTGLFSSRGSNRRGWAHQTYAEFLAAWYLNQHQLKLPQILKLIVHPDDPDNRIVPQLQETTAWLASMNSEVFQKVVETDPDVLLRSDIETTTDSDRSVLVGNLLRLYNEGRLVHDIFNNYRNYKKLTHQGLSEQLRLYICDATKSLNARYMAIDIAKACERRSLQNELADIALNFSEPIVIRRNAASAICRIGDAFTKERLKSLALVDAGDDPDDEIKGYALKAVYPNHITIHDLLNAITPPKAKFLGGTYQQFIANEIVEYLQPTDLLAALKWVEQEPDRGWQYPFQQLVDAILFKAWECLDAPEILQIFAKIAIARWRNHEALISDRHDPPFENALIQNDEKRHKLLKTIVSILPSLDQKPLWLFGSRTGLVLQKDILWMLESIEQSETEQEMSVWSSLIRRTFRYPEQMPEESKAILDASQANQVLHNEFSFWLKTIDLDSAEAIKIWTAYLQEQAWQSDQDTLSVEPPPVQRVINCLDSFEAGNFQSWQSLNLELTLLPTSQYCDDICRQPDITDLPGWLDADTSTQARIVRAAEVFIQNWQSESSGLNLYTTDVAAYKALRLVLAEDPDYLSTVSPDIWKQFSRIIVLLHSYTSDSRYVERHRVLMKIAYHHAPQEAIKTFIALIERDNSQHGDIHTIDAFWEYWDDNSVSALSEKLVDKALAPQSLGRLLTVLLIHDFEKTVAIAKSFIPLPLPSDQQERSKAVFAAIALMLHTRDAGWSVIWQVVRQDPNFGREIFKEISCLVKWDGNLELKLQESYTADLYIFLAKEFPETEVKKQIDEDSDSSKNKDFDADEEDSINIWKKYIPQCLQERGTKEACEALERIIHELPDLKDKLQWRLLEAEALTRRQTWQPRKPEEILQLVTIQKSSISDSFNRIEKLMTEQSNPNFSGATFNAPVNFAPNYGNQAQNLSIQNTEQNFEVVLTDFKQFVTDLQIQNPNVNTPEAATQAITVQAKKLPQPRFQNFLDLKRLWRGSKKASLKVGEHFAESNVWGKGAIAFLEGVSEDV